MTTTLSPGYQCWKDDRIREVINLDAIAIDPVSFLATHAPFQRIRYTGVSSEQLNDTGEENLLQEIQRLAVDQRHGFFVVEGMPGSGKSHLIRWLKERYIAERAGIDSKDVVLLIERANSSLRGTLRQIIESEELRRTGIYSERSLTEQVDRLRTAVDRLSEAALGEMLLNGLQAAALEKVSDDEEADRFLNERVAANLLLDITFREHLQRTNGPIDRLTRHLAEGREDNQATDKLPGFEPDDFLMTGGSRDAIMRNAYPGVQQLFTRLQVLDRPKLRAELADFLNRRLNFAVGRSTSLSADDLKQFFNDIRRSLRMNGHQLILFIEDITSFTGIDAGLIDVLATQHTGQENTNFARLISVVGVTNDYYLSRFPDNMKQRVTHHLRLSSEESTALLSDQPNAIGDLAARYLNAMRLDAAELQQWVNAGASPELLPNACESCARRIACHASFGAVDVGPDHGNSPLRLGLYPFNDAALTTMFNRLTTTQRTPRSLLKNVVESVLVQDGPKIKQGAFPPPREFLGHGFSAPALEATGGHDRILQAQAGNQRGRLETLLVLWGDRTVNSAVQNGERFVGSLSKGVFDAFALNFIEGTHDQSVSPDPKAATPGNDASSDSDHEINPQSRSNSPIETTREDPVLLDIQEWRTGQPLQRYEDLRKGLVDFAKEVIDWEAHLLSPNLLGDRLGMRYFKIEGQVGRTVGVVHEFLRCDELFYALRAVHTLRSISQLTSADLAGHLLALRQWLEKEEPAIVEFVRNPQPDLTKNVALTEILVADALLLASLEGYLTVEPQSAEALTRILINRSSSVAGETEEEYRTSWDGQITASTELRSKDWTSLKKKIGGTNAYAVWYGLLGAMNRSQGGSTNTKFVDADLLMTNVERCKKANLSVSRFEISTVSELTNMGTSWAKPLKVLADLTGAFESVLEAELGSIAQVEKELLLYLDGETPDAIIEALKNLFATMRKYGLPRAMDRVTLSGNIVDLQLARLRNLMDDNRFERAVVRLSNADQTVKQVRESIRFFREAEKILASTEVTISRQYEEHQQKIADIWTLEVAQTKVDELIRIIDEAVVTS